MLFPERWRHRLAPAAVALAAAGLIAPAGAAAQPPQLFTVKYTVWAEQPFLAHIFYREVDPPNYAEYSHNPYRFSPKAEVQIGPELPWVREVMLADPQNWAMVTTGNNGAFVTPTFHCELAIDGVVVMRNQGPKGALCSLRKW